MVSGLFSARFEIETMIVLPSGETETVPALVFVKPGSVPSVEAGDQSVGTWIEIAPSTIPPPAGVYANARVLPVALYGAKVGETVSVPAPSASATRNEFDVPVSLPPVFVTVTVADIEPPV